MGLTREKVTGISYFWKKSFIIVNINKKIKMVLAKVKKGIPVKTG